MSFIYNKWSLNPRRYLSCCFRAPLSCPFTRLQLLSWRMELVRYLVIRAIPRGTLMSQRLNMRRDSSAVAHSPSIFSFHKSRWVMKCLMRHSTGSASAENRSRLIERRRVVCFSSRILRWQFGSISFHIKRGWFFNPSERSTFIVAYFL